MAGFPIVVVLDSEDAQKFIAALGATRFGSLDNAALVEKLQYDLSNALNRCDTRIQSDFALLNEAARAPTRLYREHVKSIADEIRDEIKCGTITDTDGVERRLNEFVDDSWWTTYTWPAQWVPLLSENMDTLEDFEADAEQFRDPAFCAAVILTEDVRQELGDFDELFEQEN